MEYLLDMEKAVEAIERRVPGGRFLVKVVLSLLIMAALVALIQFLIVKLWPLAQFVTAHIAGPTIPSAAATFWTWLVALLLLILCSIVARRFSRRIYVELRTLEASVRSYESVFWKPLTPLGKSELTRVLAAVGPRTASIDADTNTDCVLLARDLYRCLVSAKWQVAPIHWFPRNVSSGFGGFFIWYKSSDANFNRNIHNAFVFAIGGPIVERSAHPDDFAAHFEAFPGHPDPSLWPDIQIVVGPRIND